MASRCGFTPQYAGLVTLHKELADMGGAVVGVPCNQFGAQEPGTAEEIKDFCVTTYGVDFPMLDKQDVNGDGRTPLYQHLVNSDAGGGDDIRWNFEKFIVDKDGTVKARFPSNVKPNDPKIKETLAGLLA